MSRKTAALAGLVTFAAVIVLVLYWNAQVEAALKEREELLSATADEQKAAIESFLQDRAADAAVFASFPSSIRLLEQGTAEQVELDHLQAVLENGRVGWKSRSITLIGSDLHPRVHAGDDLPAGIRTVLSSPDADGRWIGFVESPGGRLLVVAAPVRRSRTEERLGWIVLVDDPGHALWKLLRRRPLASDTGESLLVGRERGAIVFLSPLGHLGKRERPDEGDRRPDALAARRALEGPEGFGEFRDDPGRPVLAAVRQVAGGEWGLVVQVDRTEAVSGLAKERAWSAAAVLSFALALAAVLWSARSAERLRVIAELQRRDERHRLVLAQVRDAVVWIEPTSGRIREANGAAEELWGFSREELLARTVLDLRPEEERETARLQMAMARQGGAPFRCRHVRKDGSMITVEVSARVLVLDGTEVVVSAVRDVSQTEAALEQVRLLNRILQTIGAVAKVLVGEHDTETVLRRTCEEIVSSEGFVFAWFGIPGEGGLIVPIAAAGRGEGFLGEATFRTDDSPFGRGPTGTAYREGRTVVVDDWESDPRTEPWRAAGLRRGYRTSATCLVRSGETVRGVLSLYASRPGAFVPEVVLLLEDLAGELGLALGLIESDETRRRAEEEVRRLNVSLEEKVESRTAELLAKTKELESFAYSVSHDLRAPLRAIDGFSKLIEEEQGAKLDEEGRRLLGVVRESARRMARLIDDLLAFSRAGRHDLRRSRIDVGALVTSVLGEVLPESEREGSDLKLGELPPVEGDPALLRQVFVNLLSNAVKFTATRPRRRIVISGRREAGRVVYDVSDNGVGFDMRYASKLFGVFQRLHGREFEGTGVGLALVERIVSKHGGTIRAEAEPDRGARFTISFPDEGEAR